MKIKSLNILILLLSFHAYGQSLFDLEKKRSDYETQKAALYEQIEVSKQKIKTNQAAIQEKKVELVKYLKADQQLSQFQFGGLMAAEDMGKLNRNLKIFEKLKLQNLNSLRELKFYAEDLETEKKSLVEQTKGFEKLNRTILDQEKALQDLEKTTLENLVSEKKDSLLLLKGRLSEPILNAKIKQPFGFITDSKNQYGINQKGITYQTEVGQPVQAVGLGKIIFRDRIKYWGESIIIQHAGDYYSVYTNLINIRVSENQSVSASEQIGEANTKEFYFELRNKTIALNPKNWIRN